MSGAVEYAPQGTTLYRHILWALKKEVTAAVVGSRVRVLSFFFLTHNLKRAAIFYAKRAS